MQRYQKLNILNSIFTKYRGEFDPCNLIRYLKHKNCTLKQTYRRQLARKNKRGVFLIKELQYALWFGRISVHLEMFF